MSSAPLAVRPQSRALALATASGVSALALGGFTLSFTALRDLAEQEFAITPQLSFIYPLVIDGFIVIATAAAFTMKKRGPKVTWYPWAALGVFGALSVLGNAAHAIDNPSATFPAWISALGASVPAVALLIASHLLVMMIDGKPSSRPRSRASSAIGSRSAEVSATATPSDSEKRPETHPLHAVGSPQTLALADRVEQVVSAGQPVTASLIAEMEGVSERTGRRRLAALREQRPEIFADEREAAL